MRTRLDRTKTIFLSPLAQKKFVKEWIKYRFGVFDEHGYEVLINWVPIHRNKKESFNPFCLPRVIPSTRSSATPTWAATPR